MCTTDFSETLKMVGKYIELILFPFLEMTDALQVLLHQNRNEDQKIN